MQPSIGIIISVYRQWSHLSWAINSIINQKFENWKLYIISDDDRLLPGQYNLHVQTDPRIYYTCDGKHKGLSKRLNQGLDMCKEDYVMFLGADDTFDPFYLLSVADELEKNPEQIWIYGDCVNRYPGNKMKVHRSGSFSRKRLQKGNFIPCGSVVCDTRELRRIRFNENLTSFEDWEMWLVLSKFYRPKYLSEIAYNRWDDTSVMRNDISNKNKWMALKRRVKRKLIKFKFRIK